MSGLTINDLPTKNVCIDNVDKLWKQAGESWKHAHSYYKDVSLLKGEIGTDRQYRYIEVIHPSEDETGL